MNKEEYIILRVKEPPDLGSPYVGSLDLKGREELGGFSVEYAELTSREIALVHRDRTNRAIAPLVPVKLIAPTAKHEEAVPTESGATWGTLVTRVAESPYTGKGVTVAVLDTGIDAQHEVFQGIQIVQKDFTGEGDEDLDGHGTHVAGTIFGRTINGFRFSMAPGVERALIGKILNSRGEGTTKHIAEAVAWAQQEGAQIINMSIGIDFPGLVARRVENGWKPDVAT